MSKKQPDTRALAAQALADVALGGASLRDALGRSLPRIAASRDRAFVTALVNEGARWWLRFDAALAGMLERPLPKRAAVVRALLVSALVQREIMQVPAHAAVAATVDAARALGQERLTGLCNAILRRWQREREERLRVLDQNPVTRHAWPQWLLQRLRADWPEDWQAIVAASNQASPPMLRVNRRRTSRAGLLQQFADADIEASAAPHLEDAVLLAEHTDITALPGFGEGFFSVQDGAAQWAVELLGLEPGQRLLDACAAPGGKTAHALERADVDVLALDCDADRLQRVGENLQRLGLSATCVAADACRVESWWDGRPFERILLDAPCSATGVIRRHPDIKLHRRANDIDKLVAQQTRLLHALWPLVASGGRLVYATCSLLRAENESVIARFVAGRDDVRVQPWPALVGRVAGDGRQLLPGIDGVDGMFYAVLEKSSA